MTTLLDSSIAIRSDLADDADLADLIEEFVREIPARIDAMQSAWLSGNEPTFRRVVHQLRGAGGGYGFPALTSAAGAVEDALRAGRTLGDVEFAYLALLDVCRRVRA